MRRIKSKTLRMVLFFLLAAIFALLAVIEAIPTGDKSPYSIATPFSIKAQATADGTYLNTVTGGVRNDSTKRRSPDGIVVRLSSGDGETCLLEIPVKAIEAGAVVTVTGSVETERPLSKVLGVSTSAPEDMPIKAPAEGLRLTTGFVVFAVLSLGSLAVAVLFLIQRQRHRHSHHHHSKPAEGTKA